MHRLPTRATGFISCLLRIAVAVLAGVPGASAQGGAPGSDGYARRRFAAHLDRPEAVVPLGEDAVLVAERSGRVLLLDGGLRSELGTIHVPGLPIFYVPERPYTEGLKDLVPVPGPPGGLRGGLGPGPRRAGETPSQRPLRAGALRCSQAGWHATLVTKLHESRRRTDHL